MAVDDPAAAAGAGEADWLFFDFFDEAAFCFFSLRADCRAFTGASSRDASTRTPFLLRSPASSQPVLLLSLRRFASQPASSSNCTQSAWPPAAAQWNGVQPRWSPAFSCAVDVVRSTAAIRAVLPVAASVCRAVGLLLAACSRVTSFEPGPAPPFRPAASSCSWLSAVTTTGNLSEPYRKAGGWLVVYCKYQSLPVPGRSRMLQSQAVCQN